jgi:hypothetical protein
MRNAFKILFPYLEGKIILNGLRNRVEGRGWIHLALDRVEW